MPCPPHLPSPQLNVMTDMIGGLNASLDGRYVVAREIGKGGMCSTELAAAPLAANSGAVLS